jgi:triacylglycerol esterase/lipase EstA (alpha/beta hydrolase family)
MEYDENYIIKKYIENLEFWIETMESFIEFSTVNDPNEKGMIQDAVNIAKQKLDGIKECGDYDDLTKYLKIKKLIKNNYKHITFDIVQIDISEMSNLCGDDYYE